MTGNGQRTSTASDWMPQGFRMGTVVSRRFRCVACGATRSSDEPELEPGFRMTVSAADEITRLSLSQGVTAAAEIGGTDKATVSRLISARCQAYLGGQCRPPVARVGRMSAGRYFVADAQSGCVVAYFAGSDDKMMIEWLSQPFASVILPDAACLPKAVHWAADFKIGIASDVLRSVLVGPISRSATRMATLLGASKQDVQSLATALSSDSGAWDEPMAAVVKDMLRPGTPGRQFVRLRERIEALSEAGSIIEACRMVDDWVEACGGRWRDIFAPVMRIMDTYRSYMFSHPACLTAAAPRVAPRVDGSASLMTLAAACASRM